ncbi:MAG: serine/threonine protein kinase [Polyangiaceae bacterium]|nr:serine/threonine protein kinase [Polyangiaceae bacterium]
MATVFVAEQDAEPHEVALKILRAELTKDKTFAKRFEREARAAARVKHPASVSIFDSGMDGPLSYIAMELLRGDDLYTLLERHGVLSPRAAATILIEVCEALAVAHGLGIVHRDLKPENIMIVREPSAAEDGAPPSATPLPPGAQVKVLDFGIAKLLDKTAERPPPVGDRLDPPSALTAVTRAGTLIGTPAYMSPEQCALAAVDTRSDIYTCGVLLFQMLTGQLPFDGPTPLHIATKHIHESPPPLRSIIADADPRLETIVSKALAKKPAERYPTARHLTAALRKLLPDLPDVAYTLAPPPVRDLDEVTTDSYSVEVPVSVAPLGMTSAKTLVADGVAAPPPSVLVRDPNLPVRRPLAVLARHPQSPEQAPSIGDDATEVETPKGAPLVEPEPDEFAATLIRGNPPGEPDVSDLAATQQAPVISTVGRQTTMASAASPHVGERAARVQVVDVVERSSQTPNPPAAPNPPARRPATESAAIGTAGPVAVPEMARPVAMPTASVILAPSLATPAPPVAAPVPSAPSIAAPQAPTFGAPAPGPLRFGLPAGTPEEPPKPAVSRSLWIGIGIGTAISALLFAVAYALFLSR